MHCTALFSAATLLFSLAAAAPVRRDVDIVTVTQVDTVIEYVTEVVWVDGTGHAMVAEYTAGPVATSTSYAVHPAAQITTSAQAVAAAPAPTTSSVVAPAPVPTTTSTYVAPAPTSTYVAPYVAPPVPTTTSTTPVAATPTPAAASPAAPASSLAGNTYSGDITYYDVGLGSCGITNVDSDMVVAMSAAMMNKATMCGKTITLSFNGVTQTATVVDTCPGCSSGSLDLSPALFKVIAPNGDGRVKNVSWWFN